MSQHKGTPAAKTPPEPETSSAGTLPEEKKAQPKEKVSGIFVANTTFATMLDGAPIVVHRGTDRVRAGHPLLEANPQYFDAAEMSVTHEVEQATAAPGERR